MIIKRKIRALIDCTLNTTIESKSLLAGEVAAVRFKDKFQFNELLKLHNFVEVNIGEPERRVIPIVVPLESNNGTMESREIRKQTEFSDNFVLEENLKG